MSVPVVIRMSVLRKSPSRDLPIHFGNFREVS
jgi:hypothetical protein